MDEQKIRQLIRDELSRLHQSQIPAGTIKQRHIDGMVITRGLAADLPTDGEQGIQAYFATDTNVLYIWNDSAWVSETLT